MRIKFLFLDLLTLVFVIPAVILIFRWVADRRLAATFAGVLFVLVPAALMMRRWRHPLGTQGARALWWFGVLQFWILFAVPILGARLIWWDDAFESFTFFSYFPGRVWHTYANGSYSFMLASNFVAGLVGVKRASPVRA